SSSGCSRSIAWAFTGLIALAASPEVLAGQDPASPEARRASETLFGRAIQHSLGDGWRGLLIACLIAGVTSAETFMVVGSALFTRNLYVHAVPGRSDVHDLRVGRLASPCVPDSRRTLTLSASPIGRSLGRE